VYIVTALWDVRLGESGFHSRTRQGYSSSAHLDRPCYLQSPLSSGYQRLHRGSGNRDVISCDHHHHLVPGVSTAITSLFMSRVLLVGTGCVVNGEYSFAGTFVFVRNYCKVMELSLFSRPKRVQTGAMRYYRLPVAVYLRSSFFLGCCAA